MLEFASLIWGASGRRLRVGSEGEAIVAPLFGGGVFGGFAALAAGHALAEPVGWVVWACLIALGAVVGQVSAIWDACPNLSGRALYKGEYDYDTLYRRVIELHVSGWRVPRSHRRRLLRMCRAGTKSLLRVHAAGAALYELSEEARATLAAQFSEARRLAEELAAAGAAYQAAKCARREFRRVPKAQRAEQLRQAALAKVDAALAAAGELTSASADDEPAICAEAARLRAEAELYRSCVERIS